MFLCRFELQHRHLPEDQVTKSNIIQILTVIWETLGTASIFEDWEISADDFGINEDVDNVDWEE
jgi:hypothetical protein